jgi:tRNA 2-thiocytidine biosynthesis protein TtcA
MPVGQPEPGLSACYRCARERRKELFRAAEELGCRKVALAHHMDDVNETFLLNLLYTSSAAAILPKQPLFRGRLLIVRPLYDVDKPLVRRYLGRAGVRPVRNRCPHERASSRMRLRRILERLYRESPRARANLFWGLHNLKPEYLPQQSRVRQILPTK